MIVYKCDMCGKIHEEIRFRYAKTAQAMAEQWSKEQYTEQLSFFKEDKDEES